MKLNKPPGVFDMSQNKRVLEWLARWRSITQREAMSSLGISRLAARVYDLREAGHKIEREWVTVTNRWGEECRVARYRLG